MAVHGHDHPLQPAVPRLDDPRADLGVLHETTISSDGQEEEVQNENAERTSTSHTHFSVSSGEHRVLDSSKIQFSFG